MCLAHNVESKIEIYFLTLSNLKTIQIFYIFLQQTLSSDLKFMKTLIVTFWYPPYQIISIQ